jgi:hypothetical protein
MISNKKMFELNAKLQEQIVYVKNKSFFILFQGLTINNFMNRSINCCMMKI